MPKVTQYAVKLKFEATQSNTSSLHGTASYNYENGRGRQTSDLHGTRAQPQASRLRCLFLISHLCCPSCQPHSWAPSSLLVARWLPAPLGQATFTENSSVQPSSAQIWACAYPWKRKYISGQGPGPWVELGLSHRLLRKLGWRNFPQTICTAGRGGRIRAQKREWALCWQNERCPPRRTSKAFSALWLCK